MSNITKGLFEARSDWDNNMSGYRGDYGGADNWDSGKKAFRRQEADQEWKREQEYTRHREQQQAELAQYNETGKFWLKLKDTQQHLPAGPFVGKQSANQAAIELLKQQPELKGNLVITAYGPDEQINELSNATLASYKKKAGEYASAADKAAEISHKGGEHEVGKRWTDRADKRFSGIVKATKKQFDNDAEGVNESDLEEGAMDSIKSGIKSVSNRFSKKPASTASIMPNIADANTAKQAVDKAVAVVKTVDDSELPKVVSYGKQQFDSLSAPTPASDANTIAAPVATRASIPQTTTPSAPVTNTTYAQIKQLISKMDKKGKQRLLATINKSLNVTEGIPDVDHMNGPRGINLPVADTRDILQKPFEFYGNYKEWYSDVNRVNSELLDDNAEYTSMAGGKIISINGKDFAFWSNRNGNGSIDIRIAKKHSGQDVAEGSKTPTDWMGVPTKLAKNDKKPIKRPSGYDEYIKQGAKHGFQDDPTNPLRKKVKEQGVAEGSEEDYKNQRMWDQHDDDTEDLGIISQGEYWAGIHRNKQRQLDKEQQKKDIAEAGYSGVDDTDTVGFSVNSERAYQAVMSRFGNQVDHDETSGTMYVPARLWPQVEMIAFDADGEGASRDDEGIAEGTIADQPRIRKYSKIRADGSKAERYEVLDYQGRRVAGQGAEGFDDLKYAKEFFKRNYNRLINPMDEDVLTAKTKKKEKNDSKHPGKKMLESKKRYWCSIEKRWKETDENKESN
jgi:hypothetical protein